MSSQTTNEPRIPDEKKINIGHFLYTKVFKFWYIYLGSILLTLLIANFYNWYTTPIYNAAATLLLKDENRNFASQDLLSQLSNIDHTGGVENEVELIKSRSMIAKTLRRLEFDVSYFLQGNVKRSELYKQSQLKLSIDSISFRSYGNHILIKIIDDTAYELEYTNDKFNEYVNETYRFGEPVINVIGKFTIEKTSKFRSSDFSDPKYEKRNFIIVAHSFENLIDRYSKSLNINFVSKKSTIIELSLKDPVPQKAGDFLNTLMDVYIQSGIDNKNEIATNSLNFIDEQLELVTEDLRSSEADLEDFKTEKGITDIGIEAETFLGSVKMYDEKISSIDIQNSFLEYLEGYIMEDRELEKISPASIGIQDPLLAKLITQLSDLQSLRKSQLNSTKPDNPIIVTLDIQIQNTKEDLLENVRSIKNGLNASKQQAELQLSRIRSKIKTVPKTQRELIGMERQATIREGLYNYLLQKRAETAILLASTISDNRIVNSARASRKPSKPIPNQTFTFAILLGLMIPAALVSIADILDNRVKDISYLEGATNIPVLGLVGYTKETGNLMVAERPESMIAESFRLIRTNIQFFSKPDKAIKVLITSSISSEGKSFCAANLAAIYAISGKKVVLVHGDLRKPKKRQDYNLLLDSGISNFLIGQVEMKDIIQPSGTVANLDIILSGPKPPNPSELILNKRMDDFFNWLENNYDVIIVDSPPIGIVTDGILLSKYVDTSIYVIRQNVTRNQSIDFINNIHVHNKISNLSIIFNAVKTNSSFGYKYGYGYGYGHGYGYYDDDRTKKRIFS